MTEHDNLSASQGSDWAYFLPTPSLEIEFRPHGDNKYEVIVYVSLLGPSGCGFDI